MTLNEHLLELTASGWKRLGEGKSSVVLCKDSDVLKFVDTRDDPHLFYLLSTKIKSKVGIYHPNYTWLRDYVDVRSENYTYAFLVFAGKKLDHLGDTYRNVTTKHLLRTVNNYIYYGKVNSRADKDLYVAIDSICDAAITMKCNIDFHRKNFMVKNDQLIINDPLLRKK